MFKSAASKIAHNSTLPSLGGNNDLRPLQDLILAEKQVLTSLQRLSVDFAKAAEALRVWGLGEGDDLGDTLGASATLLTLWSSSISQYANHGQPMRDYLKSIRTREENLDDFKRRRKAVAAKAETAEKKLSKMGSEHKNLTMQTDSLNALRAEIRSMDSGIMTEEAALGDFKRSTARAWMGLKFGGLMECTEKGTIAGEYGKVIIAEIPEEQTQPGMARSQYYGRARIEQLLTEAHGCMNEVVMSTVPSNSMNTQNILQQNQQILPQHTPQPSFQGSFQGMAQNPFSTPQPPFQGVGQPGNGGPIPSNEWLPHNSSDMTPAGGGPPNFLPASQGLGTGQFFEQPGSPTAGPGSPTHPRYPSQIDQPGALYNSQTELPNQGTPRSVDDFGVNTQSPGLIDNPGPGSGGRFATFPIKNRPSGLAGYSLSDPPSLATRQDSDSFSSSVAQALSSSQSPPGTVPQAGFSGFNRPELSYEVTHAPSYAPPQGPPPGAASQLGPGGWGMGLQHEDRNAASDDEGGLAYMTNSEEPQDDAASRHVRFGEVNDVNNELERRGRYSNDLPQPPQQQQPTPEQQAQSYQGQPQQQVPQEGHPPQYQALPPSMEPDLSPQARQADGGSGDNSPTMETRFQGQRRVPPPSFDPAEEERALNAAAAREVSRELDALTFNPPRSPNRDNQSEFARERGSSLSQSGPGYGGPPVTQIDGSPLAPPSAPFSKRIPSPHPGADSPTLPYGQYNTPTTTFSQTNAPAQYSQGPAQYQQPPQPPAHDAPNDTRNPGTPRIGASAAPAINSQDNHPRLPPLSTQIPSSPYQTPPYQTPPEYPRSIGISNSPITKSTTSLNTQVPAGARTISAAAFKRPPQRMPSGDLPPSLADSTNPLSFKKRLPTSPYPQQREASPIRRGRSGSPAQPPAPAPSQGLPPLPTTEDDDYDYLGAYVNAGSPNDAGNLGQLKVANETPGGGGARGPGGYGEGRFATNLEGGLR
ncbi:hypothetical protein FPV67DRAFT_1767534 [Lyophyllum atratum]|nr:hypothetical protein FPV67DRAFT_1767534 [Lyophyllum atratum]